MAQGIESFVRGVSKETRRLSMKVKLEGIPIPEGWNTRMASGWSMKKILCGNTAHWSTRGRKIDTK